MSLKDNETIQILLSRHSVRRWLNKPVGEETLTVLEAAAQQAAASQYLLDWSAIRVTDRELISKISNVCQQEFIKKAPLLYIFIADEYRNILATCKAHNDDLSNLEESHVEENISDDSFTLNTMHRFVQAHNDAVLALQSMETAGIALGLRGVILGSIFNNVTEIIKLLNLPKYTFPVLGFALGYPDENYEVLLRPRLPRKGQIFENSYDKEAASKALDEFNPRVDEYYEARNAHRQTNEFNSHVATISEDSHLLSFHLSDAAADQKFFVEK